MRGAPGGMGGHTWGQRRRRRGIAPLSSGPAIPLGAACPACGAPMIDRPREEGAFLVPGSWEPRCSAGCPADAPPR